MLNESLNRDCNKDVYKTDWRWKEGDLTVTRSTQWSAPGCHEGCGVLLYTDKEGKLVKVEGDPNNPFNNGRLCMRCFALPEAMYHPDRLLYPQKRVGKRGEDKWERISWDEAYDIIEERTGDIIDRYGAKAISVGFGTARNCSWQPAIISWAAFGSPNETGTFLSGECCYQPRLMSAQALFGGSMIADFAQFYEKRFDDPRYKVPDYILLWGNEPLKSSSDGFYGPWLIDAMRRGSKLIVVDPALTWPASKAEVWLPIRPGTDAALALAMLHVMITEGLYDHEFVEQWCYGFDELAERVEEWTPERAAEICWLPVEKIYQAARLWGNAKTPTLQWGLALDQQQHGVAAAHAVACVQAITGNTDAPGGNCLMDKGYVQDDIRRSIMAGLPKDFTKDRLGDDLNLLRKFGFSPHAHPDSVLKAIETAEPYPIKMMWLQGNTVLANPSADIRRVYEALKNIEFMVCVDVFKTPVAVAYADILLPAAMGPERNGIRGWWAPLRAINKVTETGEAKSDDLIALEMCKRFNPEMFPWKDDREMNSHFAKNLASMDFSGTFDDLSHMVLKYPDFTYYKYKKGMLRPDGEPGFNTPTGKIELYCTLYESVGIDPLPYFEEPPESPVSTPEEFEEYPFVLTTGRRSFEFFHSEHRQLRSMREFHPDPIVEMNTQDAHEIGLEDGDWVWIENPHGKCKQKLKLNDGHMHGFVSAEHGWWFPEKEAAEPSLFGLWESNINQLTVMDQYGPSSFGSTYKTQLCKVYKADED